MCFCAGAQVPGVRPGGRGTFLSRNKKVPKEIRPAACVPALRSGQPALRSGQPAVRGRGLHRITHYALCAPFKQMRWISSRCSCTLRCNCPAHALCSSAQAEGWGRANMGHRCARPLCRPSAAMARVDVWLSGWPLLHAPVAQCLRGGAGTAECQRFVI